MNRRLAVLPVLAHGGAAFHLGAACLLRVIESVCRRACAYLCAQCAYVPHFTGGAGEEISTETGAAVKPAALY